MHSVLSIHFMYVVLEYGSDRYASMHDAHVRALLPGLSNKRGLLRQHPGC